MIAIVCVWMVISFLFLVLQCGAKVATIWTSAANVARMCLSGFKIAISVSSTDVLTDLLILIMPIYWVSYSYRVKSACTICVFIEIEIYRS